MVKQKFGTGKNFIDLTFGQRVVYLAKLIPKGRVVTYGELARLAGGSGRSAQSVTSILGRAELKGGKTIPFHRIVYAGGRVWLGENKTERLKLYQREGIAIDEKQRIIDFFNKKFDFNEVSKKNSH